MRRLEACQSPVWDTALAIVALGDAGRAGATTRRCVRAADWLLGEQIRARGDWAVRRPSSSPAAGRSSSQNANYPDIDDTAEVVLALRARGPPADPRGCAAAIERGATWVEGMQSSDGGWGAFDADNCRDARRASCRSATSAR